MQSIIELYKSLDAINLIIFWGIIIVIMLIIILIIMMIYKKKKTKSKLKQHHYENNYENNYEEYLPIKTEEPISYEEEKIETNKESYFEEEQYDTPFEDIDLSIPEEFEEDDIIPIEEENVFEEIVPEINNREENKYVSQPIEMPTGPYQRNVLREMSLSQTSPIGINRKTEYNTPKIDLVKDLSTTLNYQNNDTITSEVNEKIKKDLTAVEDISLRKTEVINEPIFEIQEEPIKEDNLDVEYNHEEDLSLSLPKELLEIKEDLPVETNNNDNYLEEVSRKLSEVEENDGIERTYYEIQQEEDAIISYAELMEKKDSIKTIDEEDAVISIEELMNRKNNQQQEEVTDTRLYNIDENEENDQFIKELKQFRNDL